jgi:hypothetical protein
MKIFVIGKRFSGKTPFSIEVTAACGWQHIEALNWLRSHFESGEFAHMLLDHELMNEITLDEIKRDPKQCAHYVQRKLEVGRTAVVDGLFALDDFKQFFDPAKDYVVDIKHSTSKVTATSYESELDDIRRYVHACEEDGSLAASHVFRYRFSEFRRAKGKSDEVTRKAKKIQCSSLEAATSHFVGQMKTAGLLARK